MEILTETEGGHEFVLEKLFRGSIINYRTFFMEDDGKVFYRFGRNTICSQIDFKTMINVMSRHKELLKVFKKFRYKTTSLNKPFPLDYIMTIPKHLVKNEEGKHGVNGETYQQTSNRVENVLKNVVIQQLSQIRAKKSKPSLKVLIDDYMKKQNQKDERARIRIKEQLIMIYEKKSMAKFEDLDPGFNRLIVHIKRVIKIMMAQTQAIDSL